MPLVDLGERIEGQIYNFSFAARNDLCANPQDFRFELIGIPWIRFVEGDTIRGVAFGQQKSLPVVLDFTSTAPGEYEGRININCLTCGVLIFGDRCRITNQQSRVRVLVVSAQAQGPQPIAPQAEFQPEVYVPPDAPDVPDLIQDDLRPGQRQAIDRAREKAKRAIAAAEAAYEALNAKRKKCVDCWDEVHRLEAEAAAKQAAADKAKAEADAAEEAAKAAEQHLKDYAKDLKAAEAKMDQAYKTLQMQAAARTAVGKDFGTASPEYAYADEQVDKANDAAVAAQRDYLAVRASKKAREDAAKSARAEADAKKKAADEAQKEADAAKAVAEKRRKECEKLENACEEAKQQAEQAAEEAQNAADEAKRKVDEATALAASNLKEDLDALRKKRDDCIEKLKKLAERNLKLLRVLRDLGQIREGEAPKPELDAEKEVAEWLAETAVEGVAQAAKVPTFEVFTILDGLELLYKALMLKQNLLTPGTAGYRGDDYLEDWLLEKGHASDAKEAKDLVKEITRFTEKRRTDPEYLKREWENESEICRKLAQQVAELEAKVAAAGG